LRRIRGDDFQIAALAQREERVASTAAGMDASESGAHAGIFFNEVDAAIEIIAADNDVIDNAGTSSSSSAPSAHATDGAARTPLVSTRKRRRESGCNIRDLPRATHIAGLERNGRAALAALAQIMMPEQAGGNGAPWSGALIFSIFSGDGRWRRRYFLHCGGQGQIAYRPDVRAAQRAQ